MSCFDINSEVCNLGAEEERILASFTRSLIEMAAVNPISLERANAIDAELERRFSDAFQSNDQLTLGRSGITESPGRPKLK